MRTAQKPIIKMPNMSMATVRSGGVGPAPMRYRQKKLHINNPIRNTTIISPNLFLKKTSLHLLLNYSKIFFRNFSNLLTISSVSTSGSSEIILIQCMYKLSSIKSTVKVPGVRVIELARNVLAISVFKPVLTLTIPGRIGHRRRGKRVRNQGAPSVRRWSYWRLRRS